mmetsp:Transcript_26621/g.83298  ORF Transcript_26621/g.83298 Transcript_26621/m.83298 type:complete len:330 (-) Transcript_26621:163-1152(-)
MRPHEVSMSKICDGESALTGAPVSSLQHVGSSVRRRAAEIKIGGATTPYTHPHPNCPRKRGGAPAPLTRDRSSAAPREAARSASLLPPRGLAGAEVGLRPRGEDDLAILVLDVGEGEGERGRAAHDLALLVVLGAVARAHELALGGVPGHDAAEVGAHGGEAVVLERLVVVHDEVGGVTLEALHELASARVVGAQPATLRHVVTEGVLGDRTGAAAAAAGRHEKGDVRHGHAEAGNAHGRREDGVHHVTAVHVRHEGILRGGHGHGAAARAERLRAEGGSAGGEAEQGEALEHHDGYEKGVRSFNLCFLRRWGGGGGGAAAPTAPPPEP